MDDLCSEAYRPNQRINLGEPIETKAWCAILSCTEQDLRTAVRLVGTVPEMVDAYFAALRWG